MARTSFIFYESFYQSIKELPDDQRLALFDQICAYQFENQETNGSGLVKSIFILIKPILDANNKRYENGKKGGRPNQTKTKQKPNNNQTKIKPKANKDKEEDKDAEEDQNQKSKRKSLKLRAYLESLGIDCTDFKNVDWPDDWLKFAKIEFPDIPDAEIFTQLEMMMDWSNGSPKGSKADWMGTWRNWIRKSGPEILLRLKREAMYGAKK